MRFLFLVALSLAQPALAPVNAAEIATSQDDGPYLRRTAKGVEAEWVCAGQVQRAQVDFRHGVANVPPRCGYPRTLEIQRAGALTERTDRPMPSRLAALSDIHGQYALLLRLLRANGLIDVQDRWAWGDGLLVVGGDVFDRGPQVTEAFWLLQQLQGQARAAGGDVLFLLGNHETMALYDDARYLNPKYLEVARQLGRPYSMLYGPNSVIGQWLRQAPAIARVGDTLFVHGGISPQFLAEGIGRNEANGRYRGSLGTPRAQVKADPRLAPLYDGKTSPIWYRGYFDGRATADDMTLLLQQIGVARIVVGHTSMGHVGSYFDGRVIAIDSGIKRGESGELLFLEDGVASRGLLDGQRAPLLPGSGEED